MLPLRKGLAVTPSERNLYLKPYTWAKLPPVAATQAFVPALVMYTTHLPAVSLYKAQIPLTWD